ncbi:MAG: dephospho-CoA kinase [Candidatus Microsaccharimonas sossegonensis]|uniref:Dephospho-CoA kinase n=1 Tax=Candidatus Microsaccharimonas sossegonensis TaxID=2506948 RepID=A0A4Q0AH52_9BACT|nr:MAG: dephospho-CoA kinase [Candidatus Microsaccharimonas sossegonensis]
MNKQENLKILAFVGLTGAGKTTAVEHFTEKGYPKVYFGGIIYEAMAEAGIEKGEANEAKFRVEIRQKEGNDFVVKRIIKQIRELSSSGQHRIIADGIYTWDEYKAIKHAFPGETTVVAITSPKHLRYHWLQTRSARPQTPEISAARDTHEIETLQKGGPIAAADFFIINNGSLDHFYDQLDAVADSLRF